VCPVQADRQEGNKEEEEYEKEGAARFAT